MQPVCQWVLGDLVVKLNIYDFLSIKTKKSINNVANAYS